MTPKQRSLLKISGMVFLVFLLSYWLHTADAARREEERLLREVEAKARAAEQTAVAAFADHIEKNDTEFLSGVIYRCASMAEGNSTYNVAVDHRDPEHPSSTVTGRFLGFGSVRCE